MKEHSILLLDADGDSEALVSEAATLTGRDLLVAKTSRAAFRILGEQMQRLEVVVVDVDPGAHGLALLEAISSCADRPPIVVITALEEAYMEPIARKHGAAACLGKPITVRRLTSTLKDGTTRSLTSDRWGYLVPSTITNEIDVNASFRGIAAKLSPVISGRPSSSSVRKSAPTVGPRRPLRRRNCPHGSAPHGSGRAKLQATGKPPL